ncbi:hypothetical protein MJM28_28585, partial [Salmonella enterica subsp. enterica serovar Montevideo]|nr:hypothetical protein [Salmonella enterica subsp. enterica serovar Montevideo]
YLWPGKVKGEPFDRLTLLKDILPVYQHVLAELAKRGIEWVQICLSPDKRNMLMISLVPSLISRTALLFLLTATGAATAARPAAD